MRKTNLRINNFFILEDKKKFYLSDIDMLEEWQEYPKKDLKQFLKKEITEKLQELLKLHNCKSNVNFIVENIEKSLKSGGSPGPVKVIRLDGGSGLKGGWGLTNDDKKLQDGGWGLTNDKKKVQDGGWGLTKENDDKKVQDGGWPSLMKSNEN